MAQQKGLALRTLIAFALLFSVLFGFLLQRPITQLSRKLLTVNVAEPCDIISKHEIGESLTKWDPRQGGAQRQRAQNEHNSVEKHDVGNAGGETRQGGRHNSNLQHGEPFRETHETEDTLHGSNQDLSVRPGNEAKQQTGKQRGKDSEVQLPPLLKPRLAHLQRSPVDPLTAPMEWKRPMMLSALGIPHGDDLLLAMLTTGVNLIGFGRSFNFVGCLVGNKTYPRFSSDGRSPHFCVIDSDVPEGATISLLITRDEILEEAMAQPLVVSTFTFEVGEEDLLKLDSEVKIHKDLRKLSDGYEILGIKSNITWHEGLREPEFDPKEKRFELCLMTAMRQYPFLMQQWFDYYRRIGVDQIYVYDNVSPEDLSQFDNDFVQTSFWPYGRSQFQSFNHFLLLSRNRCKYVGFLDADEYVFIGDSKPGAMKRYIKKRTREGYDQITFPFIIMAGGGHIIRPEGSLPNLYVRRDLRQNKFHVGKSVISTDSNYIRHMVHFASGGKKMYVNSTFELNPTSLDHNGMLMHYTRRSWEEYIMKTNAGGASVVTNARAPKNLSVESVPKYYKTNDSTVEYLTFRNQWRSIMEREEPKDASLVWELHGEECQQQYCIACNNKKLIGKPLCSKLG